MSFHLEEFCNWIIFRKLKGWAGLTLKNGIYGNRIKGKKLVPVHSSMPLEIGSQVRFQSKKSLRLTEYRLIYRMRMLIDLIARQPNFIKIASIIRLPKQESKLIEEPQLSISPYGAAL